MIFSMRKRGQVVFQRKSWKKCQIVFEIPISKKGFVSEKDSINKFLIYNKNKSYKKSLAI